MTVYVIAEAGVNHNGSLSLAKTMVDEAKKSGADCIKFQTFVSENLVSKTAQKAEYQKQQTSNTEGQLAMLKGLELSFKEFAELSKYCKEKQIDFLSTPFDDDSIDFLHALGMQKWKIPSGDITNLPHLIKVARLGKPILLSTGMSTMEEVEAAVSVLRTNGAPDITVLHCTTEYPAPIEDVNLRAMNAMGSRFGVPVGYSDHTAGIEIPIAAVALGATVIEKHFTLDRTMEGPDHKASLEPTEFKDMVRAIRIIEVAMGSGEKIPAESERKNSAVARKSIIAKRHIRKGEVFSEENLTVKRPGSGISPMKWFEVIGHTAVRDFEEDELIIL
jgi:N,N'-diacetyllegionaminate synthase